MASQVWINIASAKMFCQTSRYYGKTKKGFFLNFADAKFLIGTLVPGARKKTYTPAKKGGLCLN